MSSKRSSRVERALECVPSRVAETTDGADPSRAEGAGQEGDPIPDDVQLRVAGLGDVCAVMLLVPHPLTSTNAGMSIGATP